MPPQSRNRRQSAWRGGGGGVNLGVMGKIVLFGQAPFGRAVLDGLLERGHEITGVCTPAAREGAPLDPVAEGATQAGLRLIQRKSYKGEEAHAQVAAESADLGVLAFVTQIIPLQMVDAPRLGSVCFHPSLLPAFRGGSAIPWQLIKGESVGGVTLFRPDAGMDTGPIYLKREAEIGPDASAGSFYYTKIFDLGVQATLDSVDGVLDGSLTGDVQDEAQATYDPLCRDEQAIVSWNRPTADLHNLIRGCDPAPGAHAMFGGKRIRLFGSRRKGSGSATATAATPGTVLAVDEVGIEVATADGSLVFSKLRTNGAKAAASQVAEAEGISPGARLDDGKV
ncbi:MAG: methionyl-tRNA formyltransferase [Hyphomicrobiaceae bacterium]|jgi:methionyl-tRNA formyltransferase